MATSLLGRDVETRASFRADLHADLPQHRTASRHSATHSRQPVPRWRCNSPAQLLHVTSIRIRHNIIIRQLRLRDRSIGRLANAATRTPISARANTGYLRLKRLSRARSRLQPVRARLQVRLRNNRATAVFYRSRLATMRAPIRLIHRRRVSACSPRKENQNHT